MKAWVGWEGRAEASSMRASERASDKGKLAPAARFAPPDHGLRVPPPWVQPRARCRAFRYPVRFERFWRGVRRRALATWVGCWAGGLGLGLGLGWGVGIGIALGRGDWDCAGAWGLGWGGARDGRLIWLGRGIWD